MFYKYTRSTLSGPGRSPDPIASLGEARDITIKYGALCFADNRWLHTRKYPSAHILILTSHDSIFFIRSLLRSGAMGYVLKTSENKTIVDAIESVYHGLQFLSPEVKDTLVKDTLKMRSKISNHFELTDREKDILRLIAEEYTSQEIADKLFLSQRTVENYRLGLMQKLDAKNMVGMIRKAMQMGLVE